MPRPKTKSKPTAKPRAKTPAKSKTSTTVANFDPVWTAADKVALTRGYHFDPVKADRPVRFIERFCRQSIGEFQGQPLTLLPWQKHLLWRAFGWVDAAGYRRHRDVFLEVPKKNGKSELASALALYMLLADGNEGVPRVALAACDKKQAGQTFEEAARMVRASPELSARLVASQFYKTIRSQNDGVIETLSGDADSPEGGSLSAVFVDELHLWVGARRKNWNVFAGSGAARRQPLKFITSTAGEDRNSVMWEQHQRALKIESGELVDDLHFCGVVYGPRDGEPFDPTSEETWHRFNPSLGHTMTLQGYRADFEAAKNSPSDYADWKKRRLNIWHQSASKFIDRTLWAACPEPRTDAEIFESGDVWYAGLDLSSTRDITAFVRVAGNLTDGLDVRCKCWIPEEEAERRQKEQGIPYRVWAERGFITLTPGSRIDYDLVQAEIEADFAETQFNVLLGDFYNANNVGRALVNRGVPFKVIRQGFLSQNSPTKELERLVATGKLRHGNSPVLTWAISNACAERDKAGNVMLSKSKSHEKIDPAQALVNAIAGVQDDPDGQESQGSAYDHGGIFVL